MTPDELVAALHAAPVRLALAVTGGGSLAISDLLTVPGGSKTVAEALVPYANSALDRLLGARPDHYCSELTARLMAMAALMRCRSLSAEPDGSDRLLGVGVTASLASNRPKRGPHRLHVAVQSQAATRVTSLELDKGARSRAEEERLVANLVLNELAAAAALAGHLPLGLRPGEQPQVSEVAARESWRDLLFGDRRVARADEDTDAVAAAAIDVEQRRDRVLFPGSFHPLHEGHREMARLAGQKLGQCVEFELSVWNVDKPPLDYVELQRRSEQFPAGTVLWLTRAPTFVEKARLFPGATFVVGADTLERIGEPRYYGGSAAARDQAVASLAAQGTTFLVFGRQLHGRFETLGDLLLPPALRELCRGVDEVEFRNDISSTSLRRAADA